MIGPIYWNWHALQQIYKKYGGYDLCPYQNMGMIDIIYQLEGSVLIKGLLE